MTGQLKLQNTTQACAVGFGQAKEDSAIGLYDSDDACVKYNQDSTYQLPKWLLRCQNTYTYGQDPKASQSSYCSSNDNDAASCYNLDHDIGYASAEKEMVRCHEVSVPRLKSGH
ncbi:MAG TPA: hypothetical protein VEL11_00835 [Candidatus Bathyarchaeia archaeon]|nr:hypothetical protein [Candidatus Bathyarchaeia archaeon]